MPPHPPAATALPSTGLSHAGRSLLGVLESARDLLARSLIQEHCAVADPDMNHTVVSSLLQIIFLKNGEGCGFAVPGTLALLAQSDGIGKRMAQACSDAGLAPDLFSAGVPAVPRTMPAIPDAALRKIISRTDSPDFPVPSSLITLEDFAVVLEHLLATRLQVGEGYRVKKTGKSAVRYTGSVDVPSQTIINYIVNITLKSILQESEAGRRANVRILDPSCGAGIFLLASFRFLAEKKRGPGRNPRESFREMGDVACSSLFGIDIDPEAVSAARFILLLASIEEILLSGCEPVSPARVREIASCLTMSIRCGNALIGPDFFTRRPVYPFNADEMRRINPFDWESAFSGIAGSGGFDAVLGAPPPYRPFALRSREDYFQTHFAVYAPSAGLYSYFIERSLAHIRPDGPLTILVPGTFLRSRHARPVRRLLLSRQISEITDTGTSRTLQGGEARMYILSLRNGPPARPFIAGSLRGSTGYSQGASGTSGFMVDQRQLGDGGWVLEDRRAADLLVKIQKAGTPLGQYIMEEIETGNYRIRNNPLVLDPETVTRLTGRSGICRQFLIPLLRPSDIRRYAPARPAHFVIAVKDVRDLRKCRALFRYLDKNSGGGDAGGEYGKIAGDSGSSPGASVRPFAGDRRSAPKIVFAPFQHSPAFSYDPKGSYAITNTLLTIPHDDPYLAALLNSSLGRFILSHTCPLTDRGYHISPAYLGKFPVNAPDFDRLAEKIRHDKITALVTQVLSLHDYLQKAKTDQERRLVQQEIEATDVKIDALFYEMYGLTPEEIAIVEGSIW